MNNILLSNGIEIPAIGFGPGIEINPLSSTRLPNNKILNYSRRAWNKIISKTTTNDNYISSISNAIQNGFRLIDYSASYGNGSLIRKAIERAGISRNELTLTTRVSNKAQMTYTVEEEFFKQIKNMGVDYIDILMFHWPVTDYWQSTWKTMINLKKQGYVKILGVANCKQHHLEELMNISDVVPLINQFEVHPLFTQKNEIAFCKEHGITVEAYTPIARFDDRLMRLPILKKIAEKYNKSIIQIILRWHIQNGVIPVVRSMTRTHQKENINIFDFELTKEEMLVIDGININSRLRYDPDNCDFSIL